MKSWHLRLRFRPRLESLEDRTLPTAYTVTTITDALNDTNAGAVTLRDVLTAIDLQAPSGNAAAGTATNTIDFAIGPRGSVQTIDLTSPLPALTHEAFINGWSQGGPRYSGKPLIVLNGAAAGSNADGLEFDAGSDGSTVRGLVIQQFSANGIELKDVSGVSILGNYIGTNAAGTADLGNGGDGIRVDQGSAGNTIGGASAAAANVIAGSVSYPPPGITGTQGAVFSLSPASITGTLASFDVTLNYTDATSFRMVYLGIDPRNSSPALAPGGDFSAFNFIPSSIFGVGWGPVANPFPGEFLFQTPPAAGGQPMGLLPNQSYFVGTLTYNLAYLGITPSPALFVSLDGTDTTIGAEKPNDPLSFSFVTPTFAPAQQPLVNAATTTAGIEVNGSGTTGNQVLGNWIGVNPSGHALGHLSDGVLIDNGAAQNTIGGTTRNTGNFIGNNDLGIVLTDPGTDDNSVLGNHIGTNRPGTAKLGNTVAGVLLENGASSNAIGGIAPADANVIAFNGKGVVVGNSTTDTATVHNSILRNNIYANSVSLIELGNQGPSGQGANPRAYPNDGQNAPLLTTLSTTSVTGSLTSVPNTPFRVELFANPAGTSKAPQKFLGFLDLTTDASGVIAFTFHVRLPRGYVATATATNLANGDTSESAPVGTQVILLGNPVVAYSARMQSVVLSLQILTVNGPPTGGQVIVTIPGIPGQITIVPSGKTVTRVTFPLPPGTPAGYYTILASVLDEDFVPISFSTAILTIRGGVARRWLR